MPLGSPNVPAPDTDFPLGNAPEGKPVSKPYTNPHGYDLAVARTAFATAKAMGASDKVMIAVAETMIVESGVKNLRHGDRDSQGAFQQRPSQGWGTVAQVTDVAYATRSFVSRAQKIEDKHSSPGKLAQAVQISAFPSRYDAVYDKAIDLLNGLGFGIAGNLADDVIKGDGLQLPNLNPLSGVAESLKQLSDGLRSSALLFSVVLVAILLIIAGVMILNRQKVGKVAKLAAGVASKGTVKL